MKRHTPRSRASQSLAVRWLRYAALRRSSQDGVERTHGLRQHWPRFGWPASLIEQPDRTAIPLLMVCVHPGEPVSSRVAVTKPIALTSQVNVREQASCGGLLTRQVTAGTTTPPGCRLSVPFALHAGPTLKPAVAHASLQVTVTFFGGTGGPEEHVQPPPTGFFWHVLPEAVHEPHEQSPYEIISHSIAPLQPQVPCLDT